MVRCSFCNKNIERGTGKIVVSKIGKISHFCSMKCEKNSLKLKRKPIKFKWTKN
jgi:large subunit ribosomal protein L24e